MDDRRSPGVFAALVVAAVLVMACAPSAGPAATLPVSTETPRPIRVATSTRVPPTSAPTRIPPTPAPTRIPLTSTPTFTPTPIPPTSGPTPTPWPKSLSDWTTYTQLNWITGLAFDQQGYLWAAAVDGVVRWNLADGSYTRYGTEDGLTDGATSVAVAPDGTPWFGTGRGVAHLDGTAWTHYGYHEGLTGDSIHSIFVTPDGTVWAGSTRNGVSRFDGQSWTTYTRKDGLVDDSLRAIAMAPDGAMWFGTCALHTAASSEPPLCYGVSRFDGQEWTTYSEEDGLGYNRVNAIAVAADGALWFGTYPLSWEDTTGKGGVSRFDGQEWTTYTVDDGLVSNWVNAIAVAPDGVLWFGTDDGVSRFDGQNWTTYTEKDGLVDDHVSAIAVAPDGALWFGTASGLSRFDGQTWATYTVPGPLGNTIPAIAVGPGGEVWCAICSLGVVDDGGAGCTALSRFDGQDWVHYEDDVLTDVWINAMAVAPDGVLWLATTDGVSRFDGHDWTTYTAADGLAGDEAISLAVAADGTVWAGFHEGVSRFDGQAWTAYTGGSGLVAVAPDGTLWSAGDGFITHFDGGQWTTFSAQGIAPSVLEHIQAVAVGLDGALWVSIGDYGAWRLDDQGYTRYNEENGLPDRDVHAIVVTSDGAVWFGTSGGLSRFDGETWTTFTQEDGLVYDAILSVAVAPDGALWMGTYGGIARYRPAWR